MRTAPLLAALRSPGRLTVACPRGSAREGSLFGVGTPVWLVLYRETEREKTKNIYIYIYTHTYTLGGVHLFWWYRGTKLENATHVGVESILRAPTSRLGWPGRSPHQPGAPVSCSRSWGGGGEENRSDGFFEKTCVEICQYISLIQITVWIWLFSGFTPAFERKEY